MRNMYALAIPIVLMSYQSAWLQFHATTGPCGVNSLVNVSLNHWSAQPGYAYRYLNPKTDCELDLSPGYAFSSIDPAVGRVGGQGFYLNCAALKHYSPRLTAGAVGYAFVQTTADAGAGAKLGPFETHTFGLGPIFTIKSKLGALPVDVAGKYYGQFGVSGRFEGHSCWLNLIASF